MLRNEKVGIVGGGSVGVSFLYQFIEKVIEQDITQDVEIILFEPQEIIGPGYAYQRDFNCNLLNTRADTMSAIANEKDNFLKWLERNEFSWRNHYPDLQLTNGEFLPRSLFGRYLQEVFTSAVHLARVHNIAFSHVRDEVTDIIKIDARKFCLDTEQSSGYTVDRVVLCTGNLPSTNFVHLIGKPGYFASPYPCTQMVEQIAKNASVCILGTNLSAIDAALSLAESGHQGKIVMGSRNGRLPSVRGAHNQKYLLKKLTRHHIDQLVAKNRGVLLLRDVAQMLTEEIELATGKKCELEAIMNTNTGIYDYLSTEIQLSETEERLWQSVIYATNGVIDYIWHCLSLDDKRTFHSVFRSQWMSYRVSFPMSNAIKIKELLRMDRALVLPGVESVRYEDSLKCYQIRTYDKKTGFRSVVETEYVVNATSFSTDVPSSDVKLIRNLLKRRMATPNEFGGFELDFDTGMLIDPENENVGGITVLGSLATGTYFWTNAMDVNARLAAGQAANIVNQVKAQTDSVLPLWKIPQPQFHVAQAASFLR